MSGEENMGLPTGRDTVGINPVLFLEKKDRWLKNKPTKHSIHWPIQILASSMPLFVVLSSLSVFVTQSRFQGLPRMCDTNDEELHFTEIFKWKWISVSLISRFSTCTAAYVTHSWSFFFALHKSTPIFKSPTTQSSRAFIQLVQQSLTSSKASFIQIQMFVAKLSTIMVVLSVFVERQWCHGWIPGQTQQNLNRKKGGKNREGLKRCIIMKNSPRPLLSASVLPYSVAKQ